MEFSFQSGITRFKKITFVIASLFHMSKLTDKAKLENVALWLIVTGGMWRNHAHYNLQEAPCTKFVQG